MGLFDFLKTADINEGVRRFAQQEGAVLLDVRTRQEYGAGHIPGSINLPLQQLEDAQDILPAKEAPVYVYCLSGGRSRQAASLLRDMGYENVSNIGGISSYRGKLEE